jgi:tRNA(Ile)-lysidine synthase TilS/MesJ
LKDLWYPEVASTPEPEISTREALANLRNSHKAYLRIERENEKRHEENELRKQERLRKIKEEIKNLEWPKYKPDANLSSREMFRLLEKWLPVLFLL